jgi:hypothetical protein
MGNNAIQKIGGGTASKLLKVLLICGIVAPLLFVGTDIIAGTLYADYSFTDQAVSELFAIGAPTSLLVVPLFTVYSVLLVAFAFGIWMSAAAAGRNRALRVLALMMIVNAVNGLVLWNFFPMHMRGAEMTFTDTMHVTLAGVGALFGVLTVGLGVASFRNWFRFYSIGTILILLVPGILAFLYVPEVGGNQPTPWLGLTERISIYGNTVWQLVLAIVLLLGEIDRKAMLKASSSSQHTTP